METELENLLLEEFPTKRVTNVVIFERDDHSRSMYADIDNERFYLSGLPKKTRKVVYELLNQKKVL